MFAPSPTPATAASHHSAASHLRAGLPCPSQWRLTPLLTPPRAEQVDESFFTTAQQVLTALHRANDTRARPAARLQATETLAHWLWPRLLDQLHQLTFDQRGIAETTGQREFYAQLEQVIDAMIAAYRLVLADDYGDLPTPKQASWARLSLAALRILEWVQCAQRLSALRYQPLAPELWRVTNCVFSAIATIGADHDPQPRLTPGVFTAPAAAQATVTEQYLAIQTLGLFDTCSWSRRDHDLILSYCATVTDGVRVVTADAAPLTKLDDLRFTSADHAAPPCLTQPTGEHPLMILDCQRLAAAVRQDYSDLFNPNVATDLHTSPSLAVLPALQRRPFLRLLARDLDEGAITDESSAITLPTCGEPVALHVGFTPVREQLRHLFSRPTAAATSELASAGSGYSGQPRSRYAAPAPASHLRSAWAVVDQRARRLWISTRDQRAGHGVTVGTLALYDIGRHELTNPVLGKVARVAQLANGALVVELQMLASFATLVAVRSTEVVALARDQDAARLPSLLIYDADFGWGVMSAPQMQISEGEAIEIGSKRLTIASRLRRLREATGEFLLYQIDANDARLGVPAYPGQRVARHSAAVA